MSELPVALVQHQHHLLALYVSIMAGVNTAPDPGHAGQGLWSEVLNSVKNTRGVPTKNILLLGEPSTGKRTLLKVLAAGSANSTFADPPKDEQDELTAAAAASTTQGQQTPDLMGPLGMPLLGLSYGYWDVADDDSEGDCT